MADLTALAQINQKMKGYKLDILGLSEVHWNYTGEISTSEGYTLFYSRKPMDEHRILGVGIFVTKDAIHSLIRWQHA